MLSILKKRQAQQRELAAAVAPKPHIEVVDTLASEEPVRQSMADKPWEEIQAMLKQDLAYVRTLAGSQEKDPFKVELIEKYRPIVEQLLTTHDNLKNLDVIWWFYQWQIDLGKLPMVHECFRAAIDQGLETPQTWKANGQTTYCDIVFQHAFKAYEQKQAFNRDYLIQAVSDLQQGKLATNAPLKVKMFRLVGDWHFDAGEKEQAYAMFETVMKLDPKKGGRKTKLNELKEELGYGDSN